MYVTWSLFVQMYLFVTFVTNTKDLYKVELPEHSDFSKKDNTLHKDKSWMRDDAISGNSASNASRGNVIKLLTSGRHPSPATE